MTSLDIIVNQFANNVINGIKQNIRTKQVTKYGAMNASGKSADSLGYKWDGQKLVIFSSEKYFTVLETGRKAGKQPPISVVEKWLDDKPVAYREMSKKSLAYLIARKIGREGSLLYRNGGKSGVISDYINQQYIKANLTDKVFDAVIQEFQNEFING
jgi:hypothetical protein